MMTKLLDSRLVSKLFLPIALYHLVSTIILFFKERNIIRDTINENDLFYKALATLGFEPFGKLSQLICVMPHHNTIPANERLVIINKTIIGIINKFVTDENLLGIVFIDCEQSAKKDIITLNPVSLKLLKIDITDTIYSFIIALCVVITVFTFLHM